MMAHPLTCVVIGGSAGAVEVLSTILSDLPSDFPLPIVVVVHQPANKDSLLADLFATKCRMGVWEAEHGRPLAAGIFFGPPDYHLAVEPCRTLSLSTEPAVHFSRPAIDVLFESAAYGLGSRVLAILLSGASEDGARGLAAVRGAGGRVWVQAPDTALVSTMPEAGIRCARPHEILSPKEMAMRLPSVAAEVR